MHQLSGLDAMFINMEMQGMPMHVSSLSIYDPITSKPQKLVFKELLKLFEIGIEKSFARLEFLARGAGRFFVPRTDILTNVAAEDMIAHFRF